jgi:hypothetical protein
LRLLTIALLFVFLNNPSNNILLGGPAPSPWFIEHVAVESVDLPSGVSASFVTDESGRPSHEFIVLKNASSTTLYVVGKPGEGHWQFDVISVDFPQGLGPVYKVVDGQAYIWSIIYNHPGSGYYFAWIKENIRDDSVWLYVHENQVWSETGTILELDPRNLFDGDRPKDVKIPESQKVTLPIIYGTKEIQIPITISYTINPDYRSFSNNNSYDSLSPEMIYCFILVIFIVLVAGVALIVKGTRGWISD